MSDERDIMREMCAQQGWVPPTCLLPGMVVFGLMQRNEDPCAGCNHDRIRCKGRPRKPGFPAREWLTTVPSKMRDLLAAMVAEVERLREREPYHEAHVELLRQFEQTALQHLAEAKARMAMLEQQVVALRKVESTWGHRSAGKNEVAQ